MKISAFPLLSLLALWGLAAAAAGAGHLLTQLPPFAVSVLVAALTAGFAVALSRFARLGGAVSRLGLKPIIACHLVRFLGFYFLWLHARGRLPAEFAHRAGWGDVVAAAGALVLLFVPEGPGFRQAVRIWNMVGLADLVLAVGTGTWLNLTRPGSMIELSSLPLTLVPLWLVPIALVSHIVIFRRLGRPGADDEPLAAAQGS